MKIDIILNKKTDALRNKQGKETLGTFTTEELYNRPMRVEDKKVADQQVEKNKSAQRAATEDYKCKLEEPRILAEMTGDDAPEKKHHNLTYIVLKEENFEKTN